MCHLAAVSGNVKVLEVLLEEGANKDIVNRWGETPLHQAVVSGNLLAVETLTKAGASLSVSDPAGALCTAASNEDITQVQADQPAPSAGQVLPAMQHD